jgi:hypothetical protein
MLMERLNLGGRAHLGEHCFVALFYETSIRIYGNLEIAMRSDRLAKAPISQSLVLWWARDMWFPVLPVRVPQYVDREVRSRDGGCA